MQVRAAVVLVGVLTAVGLEAAPRTGVAQPEEEALEGADRPVVVTAAEVAVLAPEVPGRVVLGPAVRVQVVGRPAPDRAAL